MKLNLEFLIFWIAGREIIAGTAGITDAADDQIKSGIANHGGNGIFRSCNRISDFVKLIFPEVP